MRKSLDKFEYRPDSNNDSGLKIDVQCCENSSTFFFDRIFFILAGNDKVSDELEIQPYPNMDCGLSCPWASENNPHILIMG